MEITTFACKNSEIHEILKTGIALSKEKNRNKLFEMILDACMRIAHCDAGTLYVRHEDGLAFQLMKNISQHIDQGKDGEPILLKPVPMTPDNICAYTVIHKMTLNIADLSANDRFDFTGPKRYDELTHYHTVSMLTVPLLNQEEEAVGVLQLLNALDSEGNPIPFPRRIETIIRSLASQAAIAVSNVQFMEEIKKQMWSFTEAMAEAIDARTPYNASHVRMVAKYAGMIADYINEMHEKGKETAYFDENHKERLILSALMHDMGKVAIPSRVMNKATRLEHRLKQIQVRFHLFEAKYRIRFLEGKMTEQDYQQVIAQLHEVLQTVEEVNISGCLTGSKRTRLEQMLELRYTDETENRPYFTEEEKECLLICKGTLTAEERKIMESHVMLTDRILSKVHFNSQYQGVRDWVAKHHEYLDGSGYPNHLTAEQLPLEARILAVADICDALLATDRPYKEPLTKEEAMHVMKKMVNEGKLDGTVVEYLEACLLKEAG